MCFPWSPLAHSWVTIKVSHPPHSTPHLAVHPEQVIYALSLRLPTRDTGMVTTSS